MQPKLMCIFDKDKRVLTRSRDTYIFKPQVFLDALYIPFGT